MTPIVTGKPINRWLRYAKPAVRLNKMARMSNNSMGKVVRVGGSSIPEKIVSQAWENIHLRGFKDFFKKKPHVFPRSHISMLVVFQGIHAMRIRPRVGETVPRTSVQHHVPIDVGLVKRGSEFQNMFFFQKWVGVAVGNQHLGIDIGRLFAKRQRQRPMETDDALHLGSTIS